MLSFLSVILISSPSYSSGITSNANSATCNNSTLETYTGTSNLQANWSANEITVKWYADSEAEQPMTTNTCFYGPNSELTIPSASSMVNLKPGYTFAGWRVRQAAGCSFASSVCGLNGSAVNGLIYNYSDSSTYGFYSHDGQNTQNTSTYGLTSTGTWAVKDANNGVIRGIASCNSTWPTIIDTVTTGIQNGTMTEEQAISAIWGSCSSDAIKTSNTFSNTSNLNNGDQYCWCKITSYTPNNGSPCNTASFPWVLSTDGESASGCAYHCASDCAGSVMPDDNWRRALFGVSQ